MLLDVLQHTHAAVSVLRADIKSYCVLLFAVDCISVCCAASSVTVHTGGSRWRTQTQRSSGHSRTTGACGCATMCPWRSV